MKNRVWFLYALPFIVIIAFVIGVFGIREKFFPKAPAMEYPEQNDIVSVTAYSYLDTKTVAVDVAADDWENLLIMIGNSTPTRMQSLNDRPTVRPYYEVELKTDNSAYWYFIYEDGEQVYIETPYVGIYCADRELLDWVISYLHE